MKPTFYRPLNGGLLSHVKRQKDISYTNSESPEKILSDDMLRFVFVYDAHGSFKTKRYTLMWFNLN